MGNVPADARGVGGAALATTRNLGITLGEAVSAALAAGLLSLARGQRPTVAEGSKRAAQA